MLSNEKARATKLFLQCVSEHLSNKAEAKGLEYQIDIGISSDFNKDYEIEDYSAVIFSNVDEIQINHRKQTNLFTHVINHVLCYHMPSLVNRYDPELKRITIWPGLIVPGSYKYVYSATKKSRRWVKIR